jgi:hypothetical protein
MTPSSPVTSYQSQYHTSVEVDMIGERSNLAHLSVVATEQPSPWLHERMRPGVWGQGRVGEGGGREVHR